MTAHDLAVLLKRYARPDNKRSISQILVTAAAFCALWLAMWFSIEWGYWITVLLAIPAAGFLVRLFIIQHDCGHRSFFRSGYINSLVGRALGVFTLTPYDYWRKAHAVHHATTGNLDRRGVGDITTLTVQEYLALSRWGRIAYRLYRHPLVLFGLGPFYLFVVKHRLPRDLPLLGAGLWVSVMATNIMVVGLWSLIAVVIGPLNMLKIHLPIVLLASSIGVWLFFIQHQFEDTYWQRGEEWNIHEAGLRASSHYRLPRLLQWMTANIGLHHIHHLCSKVPNYRLQECMDDFPELEHINRITLKESLRSIKLALWDERSRKLISFQALNKMGSLP